MKDEKRMEISNILKDYESSKNKTTRKIMEVLRENCHSYSELKNEARNITKTIKYENRGTISERLAYLVENEMNDLPLTDRS